MEAADTTTTSSDTDVEDPSSQTPTTVVTDSNSPSKNGELPTDDDNSTDLEVSKDSPSHKFKPGDHVTRWEMLPIAWPIQIHGIVLSVSEEGIVLVDFGLTAVPQQGGAPPQSMPDEPLETDVQLNDEQNDEPKEESTDQASDTPTDQATRRSFFNFSRSGSKDLEQTKQDMERFLNRSFQRFRPTHEKQRLNVLVLDDPAEWKKWSKVNYGGGLFGFGASKTEDPVPDKPPTASDLEDTASQEASCSPTKGKWWKSLSQTTRTAQLWKRKTEKTDKTDGSSEPTVQDNNSSTEPTVQDNDSSTEPTVQDNDSSTEPTVQESEPPTNANPSNGRTNFGFFKRLSSGASPQKSQSPPKTETTATDPPLDSGTPSGEPEATELAATEQPESAPTLETSDSSPEQTASPLAKHTMNPAMAKLLESKNEGDATPKKTGFSFFRKSTSSDTDTVDDTDENDTKKDENDTKKTKVNLPKEDPPKLVLARTRWLLEHGESVLPKYHAFHSNSECIAVFCKTGYWTNLQADVFLHSTAIGNAKTMGATTLAVAASAPFLAPVIAGLGLGLVAAPWLLLHKSKKNEVELTQRMTDLFWAQAEPEVFVECIEHWSKLEQYYAKLETRSAETDKSAESNDLATT